MSEIQSFQSSSWRPGGTPWGKSNGSGHLHWGVWIHLLTHMEVPTLATPRFRRADLELRLRKLVRLIVQTLRPTTGDRQAMWNNLTTSNISPVPHCVLCLGLQVFLGQFGLVMLREKIFFRGYKYVKFVCCLSQNDAWRNLVKRHHYKHWQVFVDVLLVKPNMSQEPWLWSLCLCWWREVKPTQINLSNTAIDTSQLYDSDITLASLRRHHHMSFHPWHF